MSSIQSPKKPGGSRIQVALRELTSTGCADCTLSDMCPKHTRIDAHIKHAKAKHDHMVLMNRERMGWAAPEEVEAARMAREQAAKAYDVAVKVEQDAERVTA